MKHFPTNKRGPRETPPEQTRPTGVTFPVGIDDPALLAAYLMTLDSDARGRRAAARALIGDVAISRSGLQTKGQSKKAAPTLADALARLPRGDRGVGAFNDDAFLEALEISVQEIRRALRRLSSTAQRGLQEDAA